MIKQSKTKTKKIYFKPNCVKLAHSDLSFECIYPEENLEGSIGSVTATMNHIGLFEGLNFEEYSKNTTHILDN